MSLSFFGCCVKCLPLPIYQIREWTQGIFFTKKLSVFYQKRTILSFFSALQASGLTIHIFYYNVIDLAKGCAVFQHLPGLIGMEMDFDQLIVADRQQAVSLEMLGEIFADFLLLSGAVYHI